VKAVKFYLERFSTSCGYRLAKTQDGFSLPSVLLLPLGQLAGGIKLVA
jgi:hypothetical protein